MINLKIGKWRITSTEANAERWRTVMADATRAHKPKIAKGSTKVGAGKRLYPVLSPSMTTAGYIRQYAELNERLSNRDPVKLTQVYDLGLYDRPCARLDPCVPECLEETIPDWAVEH